MKRLFVIYMFCCFAVTAKAEWSFSQKIAVAPQNTAERTFHHLDASGRSNIAVSGNYLGITWEDNHSGSPQVYVAYKTLHAKKFANPVQLSTGSEAYEPCIISLGKGRFAIAWEQDGHIWLRTLLRGKPTKATRLSLHAGKQVSLLGLSDNKLLAAWVRPEGSNTRVVSTQVRMNGHSQTAEKIRVVDLLDKKQKQSYPVLAQIKETIFIFWEDRRRGHTMLLYSTAQPGKAYSKPKILNEIVKKSKEFGRGNGVARVAVASYGVDNIAATWMDKRNRQTGYDIYSAFTSKNRAVFGKNQQVQDSFGDNLAQWNPAIAANQQGDVAIVWYDNREESMDILLSTKTENGWSDDELVVPASGDGDQTNAAIVFDDKRNLHIVWIDQATHSSPTRLYYAVGKNQ